MAVTWEDRRKLMRDYFDELQMIDGKPLLSDKQQDMLFARHVKEVQDGYGAWIDINCEDKLVGFLIVVQAPNCHPDADYFVEQAYIIPSHRNHGVMSSVVDSFVQEQPGKYCLFVLKRNGKAKKFWDDAFAGAGYSPCYLRDVGATHAGIQQYGYAKSIIPQRPC